MIILCSNCNKKFEISSDLIPSQGRLLECSSCNHKWFFKKEIIEEPHIEIDDEIPENIQLLEKSIKPDFLIDKDSPEIVGKISTTEQIQTDKLSDITTNKVKKSYNIFFLILVFFISFIALIIILDTFKNPIATIYPNFEFLLYNLYESVKDIFSFIKDLI
tara:strand:+ start:473 stop:955 length:483 start_codon:yes stop_codon:yes gene_type:complete